MRLIDPTDPMYKGLTKHELMQMKYLSAQEKEDLWMALSGESLYGPLSWEKQRDLRWAALLGDISPVGQPFRATHKDLKRRIEFKAFPKHPKKLTRYILYFLIQ